MRFQNMQNSQVHQTSNTVMEFNMVNITFMYYNVDNKDQRVTFSILQITLMKFMFTHSASHKEHARVLGENAGKRLFHGFVI